MNIEEINDVIKKYNILYEYAENTIQIMGILDEKYKTSKGIEQITFDEDTVNVVCDDTCRGCYDTFSFSFPIIWLTLNNEQLKSVITTLREIENDKKAHEEELKKQQEQKKEYEKFLELRDKYEKLCS